MKHYKMIVAYEGTRFKGMQRQVDNATMKSRYANRPTKKTKFEHDGTKRGCNITIQEVLERTIMELFQVDVETIKMRFSGRTDAGVHARGQVVVASLDQTVECWQLRKDINARLPVDISVASIETVDASFQVQTGVKRKRYTYTIKFLKENPNIPTKFPGLHTVRDAFDPPCMWVVPWTLDVSKIDSVCKGLSGTHDFTNFVHIEDRWSQDQTVTIERFDSVILETTAVEHGDILTMRFTLEASGFRRYMIRYLIGYLVDVCRNVPNVPDLPDVLQPSDATAMKINAAPACGLCLESVTY